MAFCNFYKKRDYDKFNFCMYSTSGEVERENLKCQFGISSFQTPQLFKFIKNVTLDVTMFR